MVLERIAVAIRERLPAEAVDLGFALARWRFPVIAACFGVPFAIVAVSAAALAGPHPAAPFLLLWWLKPLCDRAALFAASRVLFGESPRPLAALPDFLRALGRGLLGDLTYRRLNPWRVYTMPVRVLEGLRGMPLRRRIRQVTGAHRGVATAASLAVVVFQIGMASGMVAFVLLYLSGVDTPEAVTTLFSNETPLAGPLGYWCYAASILLLEVFQVCAGFALYISRRVDLEGWDLELVFRRLALRHRAVRPQVEALRGEPSPEPATRPHLQGVAAAVGLSLLLLATPPVRAQQSAATGPTRLEIERATQEVLREDAFGTWRERTVWVPAWSQEGRRTRQTRSPALSGVVERLAALAPWLIGGWAVAAVVVVAVARVRSTRAKANRVRTPPTHPEAGPPLPLGPLPPDWLAAARRAWEDGRAEVAVSYLYRGALALAGARQGQDTARGATERETLAWARRGLVQESDRALLGLLNAAVAIWLELAYGRIAVPAQRFASVAAMADEAMGAKT